MSGLRTAICMAKKMGVKLGASKVLLASLRRQSKVKHERCRIDVTLMKNLF
jgi:hypothetical protein